MANLVTKIEKYFGQDDETRKEKLITAAHERANQIYTIVKDDDLGIGVVLLNGKPASTDWDKDAENRLYRLREMYVDMCIESGELL